MFSHTVPLHAAFLLTTLFHPSDSVNTATRTESILMRHEAFRETLSSDQMVREIFMDVMPEAKTARLNSEPEVPPAPPRDISRIVTRVGILVILAVLASAYAFQHMKEESRLSFLFVPRNEGEAAPIVKIAKATFIGFFAHCILFNDDTV
jgi:hypothetical protein